MIRAACFALGLTLAPTSQAFYIHLKGVVTDYFTGEGMRDVQVRMVKDGIDRETVVTRASGKYEFYLERGYVYLIWFYKPGWVTKHVKIDATRVPIVPDVPFYDMDLQMTMIRFVEGVDLKIFEKPLGLASYKHSVRNLSWNVDYTESIRVKVAKVMDAYEKKVFGYESKRRREDTLEPPPQ